MARKKRKLPEVNSSSSADIAFLLLIFFLVTTSMDTDKGLARRLPPPVPKEMKTDVEIKHRNVLTVLVNANNQLMVAGEIMDMSGLKNKAKEFIQNPYNDATLPEKVEKDVPFFGKVMCSSKGVISLQNEVNTEYQAYITVTNELMAAYSELRNELAKEKWGKLYADLNEEQKDAISMIYPMNISEAEPKEYKKK